MANLANGVRLLVKIGRKQSNKTDGYCLVINADDKIDGHPSVDSEQ